MDGRNPRTRALLAPSAVCYLSVFDCPPPHNGPVATAGRSPEWEPEAAEPDSFAAPIQYEPEHQVNNAAFGADLLQAIEALPILQREAFLLRAEGGLGVEEIAAVTGTNRETAKSRLRFALARLRTALEAWK